MPRDGDYGGESVRKIWIQDIDKIIPLIVDNGRLIVKKTDGVLYRYVSQEILIDNAKIDYAIEGIKHDRIRLWDAVIVLHGKPYFFMSHTMRTCTPGVTCKMKMR
ncbi:hypothetical protein MTBLM1_20273 [Rhodospirillaceae bacterium LM-1]|nr:hypothetical protein MTBLM1_20273 [Rhodospirillaceae bacterium LM-1]